MSDKMPERIWVTPLGEPDGGFWYSPCADKSDKTEYVLASAHQRALEALREAEKALERFNRGGITLFGNEEDVPITFKGKDFQALRSALARIKEAT
jgi:hypothetical protein